MKASGIKWRGWAAAILLAGAQSALVCADSDAPVSRFPGLSPGLLADLGGRGGLQNIVDQFYEIANGDNRINAVLFDRHSHGMQDAQKQALIQTLMGTPSVVVGTSHAGITPLTTTQYNALVEDLYAALELARVSYHTSNRMLATLAPYQSSLVSAYLNARPSIDGGGEVHVGPVQLQPPPQ